MDSVGALSDTQRAFDGVAAAYHRSNADNALLEAMRHRFRQAIDRYAAPRARLLDLGCGPGTDEVHFASRGYRVTAIDWSPAMAHEARRRVREHDLQDRVDVHHLGIHEIDRLAPSTFDVVCSNLGPLNCVTDLESAARLIADRVRPGGIFIASVIGRICPWELALYAARRDWPRMRARFAPKLTPVPLEGRTAWTRYYTPAAFERTFAAVGLEPVERRTLALLTPPPYLQGFAARHPAATAVLQRLDDAIGGWPGLREMGDHFLVAMRKAAR